MPTLINENRIFQNLPHFFSTSDTVFDELLQNACRAGATEVKINYVHDKYGEPEKLQTLTYRDNGEGVKDVLALLCLGETQFEDSSVWDQNPAGMGFMHVLAHAKTVTIRSHFGTLVIQCHDFFQDRVYRDALFDQVDPTKTFTGLSLEVEGTKINLTKDSLDLYPVELTINGDVAPRHRFDSKKNRFELNGYTVWCGAEDYDADLNVSWYGQKIPHRVASNNRSWLLVDHGSPLNLRLPDRTSIINDDLWSKMQQDFKTLQLARAVRDHETSTGALRHIYHARDCLTPDQWKQIVRWPVQREGTLSENGGGYRGSNSPFDDVLHRDHPGGWPAVLISTESICVPETRESQQYAPDPDWEGFTIVLYEDPDPDLVIYNHMHGVRPDWTNQIPTADRVEIQIDPDKIITRTNHVLVYQMGAEVKLVAIQEDGTEILMLAADDWEDLVLGNDPDDWMCIINQDRWKNATGPNFSDVYNSDGEDGWDEQSRYFEERVESAINALYRKMDPDAAWAQVEHKIQEAVKEIHHMKLTVESDADHIAIRREV